MPANVITGPAHPGEDRIPLVVEELTAIADSAVSWV
jgi:hypothetical protein